MNSSGRRQSTQADPAARLDISSRSVNAIEPGRFDPSLSLAFKLAKINDSATEAIFTEDSAPS
jgi:putative transcriptional regulator